MFKASLGYIVSLRAAQVTWHTHTHTYPFTHTEITEHILELTFKMEKSMLLLTEKVFHKTL